MVNHRVMWLNWGRKWQTNGLCGSIGDVNGKLVGYDSIGDVNGKRMGCDSIGGVNGKPMGYVAQLGV